MTSLDDGAPELFSRAAPIYNAVGPRHFSYFAQRLIEFAQIRSDDDVLDVATGTGVVLVAAAERVGDRGHVVGVDAAGPMRMSAIRKVTAFITRLGAAGPELGVFDHPRAGVQLPAGRWSLARTFTTASFESVRHRVHLVTDSAAPDEWFVTTPAGSAGAPPSGRQTSTNTPGFMIPAGSSTRRAAR